MNRDFYYAILIAFFAAIPLKSSIGQSDDPYPPSPVPDRIVLTWSGDPATTQSVTWRTDNSIASAFAEIALASPDSDFGGDATQVPASTTELKSNHNSAHYHSATFTELMPGTQYAYRVGDGNSFSEWFHFKTAGQKEDPLSFVYFGDAQNAVKSMWSRCVRQGYSTMPAADFFLHAGDLINIGDRDEEWGEWFYAAGWINGMRAQVPVTGNHEYYNSDRSRTLSTHWRPTFTLPENGPKDLLETVYYLDYQDLRIIVLNSMVALRNEQHLAAQVAWLESVLEDNPCKWTVVAQHHPIYSTARERDNSVLRQEFQPLYEKYGVDLVLQGHDHAYGRGHNVAYGEAHKDKGPVYVVSVSGPKMYPLNFEPWLDRAASNTQLYQTISIDNDILDYVAYTTTGERYDAFTLKKKRNGVNKWIDRSSECVDERLQLPPGREEGFTPEEMNEYQTRYQAYKQKMKEKNK